MQINGRMKGTGIHMGPHIYHNVRKDGLTKIPALNLTDHEIIIRPGIELGMFKHAVVEEVPAEKRGPTMAKQKKVEYL